MCPRQNFLPQKIRQKHLNRADDSTLDKPYSRQMALVGHIWSGKHHRVVKGINLITLYYTDPQGRSLLQSHISYDG